MGESITEGTLTEWHKSIGILIQETGDFIARDEQIATIETDKVILIFMKIDVQVNSPESGNIIKKFFKEGETVSVGANLFEIELGESAAKIKAATESGKIVERKDESFNPADMLKAESGKKGNYGQPRVPLIRFLGPRKLIKHTVKISSESNATKQNGARFIQYESIYHLPKRFQPIPFSDAEIDAIDVLFALN
jgi:pyruvate/2-oxoglutarate dehydrogenase complex dihydrolipoamide acyltransferase (E2) component